MRIRVTHLDRTVTPELVREKFVQYGAVQSVTLLRGADEDEAMVYVEMPSPEDAALAMRALDGAQLCGRVLRVDRARSITMDPETTT